MTEINIMNRTQIEALSQKGFAPHTMVISICDYGDEGANILHFPEFFMKMRFNDVDDDVYLDAYGKPLSAQGRKAADEKYHPIDGEQIDRLMRFYFSSKDKAELIICQCEHGESRSAAIAAAIDEYENNDGLKYFVDDAYCPNKLVFRKVYKALCERGAK